MASKRRVRRASCEGKKRFSIGIARKVADQDNHHLSGISIRAYHCSFCDSWHVGRQKVAAAGTPGAAVDTNVGRY